MEKHFLADHVEGEPGFTPGIWYNAYGDCLEYSTANVAVVADRIDEVITIYRSADKGEAIGFQIKGVSALVEMLDADAFVVEHLESNQVIRSVKVNVILAMALQSSSTSRTALRQVGRYADLLTVMPRGEEAARIVRIPNRPAEPAMA